MYVHWFFLSIAQEIRQTNIKLHTDPNVFAIGACSDGCVALDPHPATNNKPIDWWISLIEYLLINPIPA